MDEKIISLSAISKIIKKAGAGRVSPDAKEFLRQHLESISAELCAKAVKFSSYSGRKTIRKEDLELALKQQEPAKD